MNPEDHNAPDLEPEGPSGLPPASAAPPPAPEAAPASQGEAYTAPDATLRLVGYLGANRQAYTEDALRASARAAGYAEATIDEAFARIAAFSGVAPIRGRARMIIFAAYGLVFLVLSAGMAGNNNSGGIQILAISLGVFLLLSLFLVRGRKNDTERFQLALGGLLAAPLLFLFIIGGICLATGLPLRSLVV